MLLATRAERALLRRGPGAPPPLLRAAVHLRRSATDAGLGGAQSNASSLGHLPAHSHMPSHTLDPRHEIAISFGGSGLMLIYQAGVASAFHACAPFMARVRRVLGTSGGACVGVLLLGCPDRIGDALEHYCQGGLFRDASVADVLDPTDRLLPRFVQELGLLPDDAYKRLRGEGGRPAMAVHMTPLALPLRNHAVTDFQNNAEVIRAVQASCCLNPRGVEFRGERYVDGGLSDSLPLSSDQSLDTVTVSPFAGSGIDVSPGLAESEAVAVAPPGQVLARERARVAPPRGRPLGMGAAWLRYKPTLSNAQSLMDAAIPRGRKPAERRFAAGRRDGVAFLRSLGYAVTL